MSLELYAAFLAATIVIIIIPGPMVTLIAANSLTHGTRAGLLNVAGSELGLMVMLGAVIAGLTTLVATLGWWFEWVKLAGALYLVWIGWKLLRSPGLAIEGHTVPRPRGGFVLQGFLISISNPKTLFFFGAFFPQFLDPARDQFGQILLMGITAMVVAAISDSTYALLLGRAGALLSAKRQKLIARFGGACLIGGGLWLAFSRSR